MLTCILANWITKSVCSVFVVSLASLVWLPETVPADPPAAVGACCVSINTYLPLPDLECANSSGALLGVGIGLRHRPKFKSGRMLQRRWLVHCVNEPWLLHGAWRRPNGIMTSREPLPGCRCVNADYTADKKIIAVFVTN